MSPPTGGGRAPGVGVDDQRFPTRSLFVSRYLEQLDCRKLDLLVPPLCGSVRAGDQLHPVDPTEVAIDEGVARMRAVLRAHGQAEVSFGVVVPQARLEVGVLVVARGWRSMTTRSTTQRVARRLAGRFQGALGDQRGHHPLGHLDVQPSLAGSPCRCPAAPTADPASMSHPTSGRRRSRPHRPGRRPRPAPRSLPADRRHQPGQRRAVDLVGPRSCGSPLATEFPVCGVLSSRIRRKLTRPGQPIAMRNSSTSAIGRTTGRRASTSARSSPRSTRSSSRGARPAAVHARRGTRRATSNACKDGARLGLCTSAPPRGANETRSISARSRGLKLVLGE
jgi:hypothetical protein